MSTGAQACTQESSNPWVMVVAWGGEGQRVGAMSSGWVEYLAHCSELPVPGNNKSQTDFCLVFIILKFSTDDVATYSLHPI